jgi:endonuclease YncB( thermonuclease family)
MNLHAPCSFALLCILILIPASCRRFLDDSSEKTNATPQAKAASEINATPIELVQSPIPTPSTPNIIPAEQVSEVSLLVGKVTHVHTGDYVTVDDGSGEPHMILLRGIDAPEDGQPQARESKRNLSFLILGKTVRVTLTANPIYGEIGTVTLGNTEINLAQLESGMAWHHERFAAEQTEREYTVYNEAQTKARNAKLGLWKHDDPIAPWVYYSKHHGPKPVPFWEPNPDMDYEVIGNRQSRIYHLKGCSSYGKVSPKNRVNFKNRNEAEAAGYRIAKNC